MNQDNRPVPGTPITRRNWLALAVSVLAGCGGGGTGVSLLPGTGGTGIFAQGAIAGFGSVIVNGIKFDDSGAVVQIDGVAAGSLDLRLGMVAGVQGQRGADPSLGIADRLDVWSVAQGSVTQVQADQFGVAGMTIQTNSATVFDGVSSAAVLGTGQTVVVWGLNAGADGKHWIATRLAVLPNPVARLVSTGLVTVASGQRSLNGMQLQGPLAVGLTAGQLLRVEGVVANGNLTVSAFKVMDLPGDSSHEVKIEGVVTQVLSATRFMLGNIEVDSSAVAVSSTPSITIGLRIEVRGILQGQLLKASALDFESEQERDGAKIEGVVEKFTSLANFVVRGQRCDASGAAITHGKASDLKVGVKVKVEGTKAGDVLRVSRLEIGNS
ncbi:MAG: DUF5666 domain-containing protein [Ramlibacter sp.]